MPQKLPYLITEVTKQNVIHNEGVGGSEGKFMVALSSHVLDSFYSVCFISPNIISEKQGKRS